MATQHAVPQPVDWTTWGDRLRRIRLNNHMDQAQFAEVIRVKKPTVGKYELQPTPPRMKGLIEDSVELHFGKGAADYLRGEIPTRDYEKETSGVVGNTVLPFRRSA